MDETARDLRLTRAYRYELPEDLIAKVPADPPDASRLMAAEPAGERKDLRFADFPSLLARGDVLVLNETRVVRARLRGKRVPGEGAAEILLLRPAGGGPFDPGARRWLALARPGTRLLAGRRVRFGDEFCEITHVRPDGIREIEFDQNVALEPLLERYGEMPLPPYVGSGDERRAARYQTVFARVPGSVAAPTASLHFTEGVLDALRTKGVTIVPLVLDVGLGTFKPIESERIDDHVMHAERFAIPPETAAEINRARGERRRVVAAGTTVLRALETAGSGGEVLAGDGETSLFVTPGYRFRIVDALLTNFHLPASTLLVLVTAFGGYDAVMDAYRAAVAARYRFYSFGDAMFVVRNGVPA